MSTTQPRRAAMVAAPQAQAAYEGARVLRDGGTAADALVTAAFVQGVVDPHRCGIGGFGCATVYASGAGRTPGGSPPEPQLMSVDFHGRAGSRCREDQWVDVFESAAPDGFGYITRGKVNDVGYKAITVPGMVAGISAIHGRFGSMPWKDLVLRAVPYAEEGFLVPAELAEFWIRPGLHGRVSTRERLALTAAGRKICLKNDGETYKGGEILRQPLLAATYRRLAQEGPETFYRGPLAAEIAADWEANDALVTGDDLAAYRPQVHEPVRGTYGCLNVVSTPLPGGGVALLQALALLEQPSLAKLAGGALRELSHNEPGYIDRLARVFKAVWRDRLANHGDPEYGGLAATELLSADHLATLGRSAALAADADSESTTQLTIVDREDNAISFSHSLGYGSGVFCPNLGFMFNNCMSAFDPRPGRRNSIAPGKARSTAVAETMLLDDGRPVLVLGSPGAARITAGLAQVILNTVDFGMSAAEAVVCPRLDAYGERQLLLDCRFSGPCVREMRRLGWDVLQSPKPFGVVGRVYAIELERGAQRRLIAGVDPGEPGAAFAVP